MKAAEILEPGRPVLRSPHLQDGHNRPWGCRPGGLEIRPMQHSAPQHHHHPTAGNALISVHKGQHDCKFKPEGSLVWAEDWLPRSAGRGLPTIRPFQALVSGWDFLGLRFEEGCKLTGSCSFPPSLSVSSLNLCGAEVGLAGRKGWPHPSCTIHWLVTCAPHLSAPGLSLFTHTRGQ